MNDRGDSEWRGHLISLLQGKGAHLSFEQCVDGLTPAQANQKLDNLPYTIWHVLEHMRIAQWDILEFSRNPNHQSPEFPDGYWPAPTSRADGESLTACIATFLRELKEMEELVADPRSNLFEPFAHGTGQTLFREALLVADHNSYHLGALLVMKRMAAGGVLS